MSGAATSTAEPNLKPNVQPKTAPRAQAVAPAGVIPPGPIDLVLEGGGVKGIGLVGAVLELHRAGYQVQRVAGTSAGAIVASLVAALNRPGHDLEHLDAIMTTIDYPAFMRNHGLRGALGPLGAAAGLVLHMGLYDGDYLLEWLGGQLQDLGVVHFSDLPLATAVGPLTDAQQFSLVVHTADLTRKRTVRLPWDYPAYGLVPETQRVVDAVRASMAIPFFFAPVRFRAQAASIGGQATPAGDVVWVDGGLLDNFPLDVFTNTETGAPAPWPTVGVKLSARAATIPTDRDVDDIADEAVACLRTLLDNADRFYVDESKAPATIFVDSQGVTATDFHLDKSAQDRLFEAGRQAARTWIAANASS